MNIVIAVLTYQRPDDLAQILPLLISQAATVPETVEVLVVDNDPLAGARPIVEKFTDQPVSYVSETAPGIAAARNRALDSASGADILVFIDDDERPVDDWLARLLATWNVDQPAGVVGPVISEFAIEPSDWLTAGRFFDRRRLPTGTRVDVAATNNLLLDMRVIRDRNIRFDVRFGLSGGSDTLFSRQLTAGGGELVWCDEAVVFDMVPASRLTPAWVLQRAYRSGNGWSRVALTLAPNGPSKLALRISLTARGSVRLAGGLARVAMGRATRSLSLQARGARTIKRGSGMVSGAWGQVYSEYARS